jgi:CubicO group peptidase (beta-lactamase class C family)
VAAAARDLVRRGLSPGLGVAVAVGDRVVFTGAYGVADADTGRPVSEDSRFYIGSTTKSFTGLAVALGVHRGELDLDAPFTRYVPAARLHPDVSPASLTLRRLVTLTHGLDDGPVVFRTAYTGDFSKEQLLELLRYHPPTGRLGVFDYNNLGYNLAGFVLEARYGRPWQEIVRREVLDPVGMSGTTAYASSLRADETAMPHELGPAGYARIRQGKSDANMHAAGGHFSTMRDLGRYLAAHLGGGLVEGRRVLPRAAVLLTQGQQVAQYRTTGQLRRVGWGIGWDISVYEGDRVLHRNGAFAGARSFVSFMPESGFGVAVQANGGGLAASTAEALATYVYDRLLGRPRPGERHAARVEALDTRRAEAMAAAARKREERRSRQGALPRPLDRYAGVYENPQLGRMEWRVVGGGLEVRMGVAGSTVEIDEAGAERLAVRLTGGEEIVDFAAGPPGRSPSSFTYGDQTFTRVSDAAR